MTLWFRASRSYLLILAIIAEIVVVGLVIHPPRLSGRQGRVRLGAPRERTVRALWFAMAATGPASGTSNVTIRVASSNGAGGRVGFYETEAEGAGPTWQAAGWMATVVASLTLGVDLGRYVPSFEAAGRIDGPSAGALLTVGLMAALEDRDLRPKATVTGAIGPDGTIAPVAGVAHKVEAAARAGMDLVLVPAGQRRDMNWRVRQPVDVVALGKGLGVEVREVGDVGEAYALLTGRRLGLPTLTTTEPSLPGDVSQKLAEKARAWLGRYSAAAARCAQLSRELRGRLGIEQQMHDADQTAVRAQASLDTGHAAAAYDRAVTATLQAAIIADVLASAKALAAGGPTAAADYLGAQRPQSSQIDATLDAIGNLRSSSPDAALAVADAYGIVTQSIGLRDAVAAVIESLRRASGSATGVDPSVVDRLFKVSVMVALERQSLALAKDRLDLAAGPRAGQRLSAAAVSAWAATMHQAASASLSYFEAVAVDDAARRWGVHPDDLRNSLGYQDLDYLLATTSLAAVPTVQAKVAPGGAGDLATLGTAVGGYAGASALVAKFYSLRVRFDEQLNIVGVEDMEGLRRMLRQSAARARANIAAARAGGLSAALPTFYYEVGRAYAEGGVSEQLDALQCYWQASLYARIGCLLS